ncbi:MULTISPECIES: DUF2336 domain-containing protein [Rhodopseudomonas]|uniref:Flagellar biosynthesis protein FlhF n=1 Tax=Rhodopseudomonas palustris TaxID=1076 RepID=A0A0D7EQX2_RHOPL|nr:MULTISPECIES: DUF2336 domain-containing protein [Rhodopseudomonas]KIZ41852.1 flagellar biosynthesis protein FlhF [Rhodopseudomonas palustris]MDF3811972.1 DUF2336 domain-containing protein [Rhodopseudomonas sp. BAL398]WOK20005.1 DUF2336 domain-containing protein [Rhodopseudomonas sp. BAL398]
MTAPPMFPGFDGLMTLSRREGVDIRPTLLRVLTDLYVQSSVHSIDEEKQFVELTSRLIDQVDDATRAAVRARLSIYPNTPNAIAQRLSLRTTAPGQRVPQAERIEAAEPAASPAKPQSDAQLRSSNLTMQPDDAAQINEMFFAASSSERTTILHNLDATPLKPAARIYPPRAARAIETLQMAAFAADAENFVRELGDALILPAKVAERVASDPGGEPLACAAKALGMDGELFERVLMFLDPALGASVDRVYRLSRLYDNLSERSALIMLAAWRGATVAATRAKYRSTLHDDERHRARASQPLSRPTVQPGASILPRTGTGQKSGS